MRPFRLAGLGRLRRMQEDQAAAELARRTQRRRQAEQRGAEAWTQLDGAILAGTADAQTWRASVAARAAASAAVTEAAVAVETAHAEQEHAQGEWSVARARTSTVDKLAQRHWAAEREAELRAEQHTLDELAARRAEERKGEQA